jgi:cobalamin biosynthesis protein CobT
MIGLISSMANELQHSKPDTKHINHPIIELSDLINVSEDEECEDDDDDDDDDDIDENSDDENSDDGDDKNEKSDDEKSDDEKSDDEKSDEKSTDCNIDISNIEITNIDAVDTKIKSIHITESLEEKINYKKMKIDQLKTIVTQKGLGDAAFISKFKKDDLIKLLSE